MTTKSGRRSRRSPLATPKGTRTIISRYGGTCDHCGQRIYVNGSMVWFPGQAGRHGFTFHPHCAPSEVKGIVPTPIERKRLRDEMNADHRARNAWRGQLSTTSDHRSSRSDHGVGS